jgi:hypothetical protein
MQRMRYGDPPRFEPPLAPEARRRDTSWTGRLAVATTAAGGVLVTATTSTAGNFVTILGLALLVAPVIVDDRMLDGPQG